MEIYMTTHTPTGKKYIGKDKNSDANYYGSGRLIKEIIKAEGKFNLVKTTIENCSNIEDLVKRERFWLEYYDAENNPEFLNLTNKPFGNSGHSQETRDKMSKSHIGMVVPDDIRKKMSENRKGHAMYTAEWAAKIGKANAGKPKPEGFGDNMKITHLGNTNRRKAVNQYDLDGNFIKTWESVKSAADSLGKQGAAITEVCNHKSRKKAYNYIWKYQE
tara:strand:+ start:79 stop:729 length:651 start_codon:yes stop_codon:yes gene_type:complete